MKAGDLVRLKPDAHYLIGESAPTQVGVIFELDVYGESGLWYHVQWNDSALWHTASDLELVSESR